MPSIGYGSNKKTRHLMPDGFKKFVIHNVKVTAMVNLKFGFRFSGITRCIITCSCVSCVHSTVACSTYHAHTNRRVLVVYSEVYHYQIHAI